MNYNLFLSFIFFGKIHDIEYGLQRIKIIDSHIFILCLFSHVKLSPIKNLKLFVSNRKLIACI